MTELVELLEAKARLDALVFKNTGSYTGTGISQSEGMVNVYLRDTSENSKKKLYELLGSKKVDGTEIKFIPSGNVVALQCSIPRTVYSRPACGGTSIGHACFDTDTVLMSKDGFVKYNEINYDTELATLNQSTQELEWQTPTKIYIYDYNGEMVCSNGSKHDVCVTPNHRIYYKKYKNKNYETYEFIMASEVVGKKRFVLKKAAKWEKLHELNYKIPLTYDYIEEIETYKKIIEIRDIYGFGRRKISTMFPKYKNKIGHWLTDGVVPYTKWTNFKEEIESSLWFSFIGWYLSEGSCNVNDNRVQISQSKKANPEYYNEIVTLLKDIGFKVSCPKDEMYVTITSKQLVTYLSVLGLCNTKFIPKDIKDSSKKNLNIMLNSMFKGDGSFISEKYGTTQSSKLYGEYYRYFTTSKQLAEDVCEILVKLGYGFRIYRYTQKNGKMFYTVSVQRGEETEIKNPPYKKQYNGKVWCVEVPNGIIYAIRNGKGVWSGNSVGAGTFGTVVYNPNSSEKYILTNNHVGAASSSIQKQYANIGDLEYAPGCLDSGGCIYPIGKLYKYIPFDETTTNFVDCSLIKPDNQEDISDEIIGIGRIVDYIEPLEKMRTQKSGRTSGVTEGDITDFNATIEVDFGNKIIKFANCIITTPQGLPGDSGSILVEKSTNKAVGLLFAGSDQITVYNRISYVLQQLNVAIIPNGTIPTPQYVSPGSTEYQVQSLLVTTAVIGLAVGLIPILNEQVQMAIHRNV